MGMIHLGHLCFEFGRTKNYAFRPYFQKSVFGYGGDSGWWGAGLLFAKFSVQVSWKLYE